MVMNQRTYFFSLVTVRRNLVAHFFPSCYLPHPTSRLSRHSLEVTAVFSRSQGGVSVFRVTPPGFETLPVADETNAEFMKLYVPGG